MNFTVISDTHSKHTQLALEEGDVLIHAGDIEAYSKETLINFLGWFSKQRYAHKIFIAGNHDGFIQEHPGQAKYIIDKYDVHYLQDNYVTINGIKIYGIPWTVEFGGWSWMKEQEELEEIFKAVPDSIDILVCHGPPYKILDKNLEGEHCGAVWASYPRPDYYICGHIHEAAGQEEKNDTIYINCSVVTRFLDVKNKPINFKYNK